MARRERGNPEGQGIAYKHRISHDVKNQRGTKEALRPLCCARAGEKLLELAGLNLLFENVKSSDELSLNKDLRECWPVIEFLHACEGASKFGSVDCVSYVYK